MNTRLDLGHITEPVLLFGGCYSNLQATQALRDWAEQNGFAARNCLCTGDIVAYAANPVETVALIRDWGVPVLQGNVEQSLATQANDCGCGFAEGSVCDVLSQDWFAFADRQISADDRAWFAQLPQTIRFQMAGKQCEVVHGGLSDISRFMFASMPDQDFAAEFALTDADVILAGHCGIPFTKTIMKTAATGQQSNSNKVWHNSGVIGMPANDGQVSTWFSVLSPVNTNEAGQGGDIHIQHHVLYYDAATAHESMVAANLQQGYHQALLNGLWPSMDVLPETERQQAGQPLHLLESL